MKYIKKMWSYLCPFLLFFILCGFVVTCSFLLFLREFELPEENLRYAAFYTFINIIFIAVLFTIVDIIRRKITVEHPVKKINEALDRITEGDFSVRIDNGGKRNDFTKIMENINRMTEELSGVETLRTDFIANVSHELKTPLAVIQNFGVLLQTPGLSEEKRMEYAKGVTDASRRLSDMVTNILKLNRLENQQIYPQIAEYNLGEQLCECLLQYENIWEQSGIGLDTDIEDNVIIKADAELLSLVWNNLFSNAFKFTESGGTVFVSLTATEEHAIVKVQDTGCGMSSEIGAHIFEKFYQGDSSHSTQGNGLGLALVKRVMDITHGEITVESIIGKGSTFTVKIRRF